MLKKSVLFTALLGALLLSTLLLAPAAAQTPTPTAAPSATGTATPAPGATPAPVDVNGMTAFCWPKGSIVTKTQFDSDTPPANAKLLRLENDQPTLWTVNDACTFVYTASAAIPEGTQLQVADGSNAVWLKTDMKAGTKANSAYAALQHGYIVDPPFWSITYTIKVVTKDGKELWSSPFVFRRGYEPGKCYDGSWPDPVTWYCYYPPDAHPWDSWYKFENPKP